MRTTEEFVEDPGGDQTRHQRGSAAPEQGDAAMAFAGALQEGGQRGDHQQGFQSLAQHDEKGFDGNRQHGGGSPRWSDGAIKRYCEAFATASPLTAAKRRAQEPVRRRI